MIKSPKIARRIRQDIGGNQFENHVFGHGGHARLRMAVGPRTDGKRDRAAAKGQKRVRASGMLDAEVAGPSRLRTVPAAV